MVDHFRVMRLIGRGGMGEVYLARDTRLGRKVALKVINPRFFDSPRAVERFLFEARTTARFNHPNIVTVYAVAEHEERPYVALEYLEGQTLRQRMVEERPSPREVMRTGLAIAEALAEAHRHGVLHQDLKPENVLIPRDGRLRVVDFGLATLLQQTEALMSTLRASALPGGPAVEPAGDETRSDLQTLPMEPTGPGGPGALRGTPRYMAPEQWMDHALTTAADVWALGVMLYELIAGKHPYRYDSMHHLASLVVSQTPVPRSKAVDSLPADLADLVLRCLSKDPAERPTAETVARSLERQLASGRRTLSQEQSPFRGLLPFGEQHADLFHGRDAEVAAFLERLREEPVLPVLGPSGAGKSSFVQAGVIPRLREQGPWTVLRLRPGTDPFRTLASRLLLGEGTWTHDQTGSLASRSPGVRRDGDHSREESGLAEELRRSPSVLNLKLQALAERDQVRVLLFVDQLEELFTLIDDEALQRAFMEALCSAADDPHDPVRVVFTLREDFLGRIVGDARVRTVMGKVTVLWSPGGEALRETLSRPVSLVGYAFDDPTLVDEMVDAVGGESACLPLLQFAGRMLWERRDRKARKLRRADYEAIGGVAGALAHHADSVLEGMSQAQLDLTRQIMLRLVTADGTRRVVARRELLESLDPAADDVVGRLVQARLLSARKALADGEVRVELVHESLTLTWDRLARWLDESREDLVFLGELTQAAELWLRRGERAEEVWQGDALLEARRFVQRSNTQLPGRVLRFVEAGTRRAQRRQRRKRVLVWALVVIPSLIAVLFIAKEREATFQKDRAEDQTRRAEAERRRARSRWAEAQREGARAALAQEAPLEARARLRGSLEREDSLLGRVLWWRLQQQPLVWKAELGNGIYHLAFSPDGKTLAAAGQDATIYLFDVETRAARLLRGHHDQVFAVDFSPDGKLLASGGWDGTIRLWSRSGQAMRTLRAQDQDVRTLAFSPDGTQLASGGADGRLRLWDPHSGALVDTRQGHSKPIYCVVFSANGQRLASAGRGSVVLVWDPRKKGAAPVARLEGHRGRVEGLSFSPDGRLLASAGEDRSIRVWDLGRRSLHKVLWGHAAHVEDVAFTPDGKQLLSGGWDKTIRLWDLQTGRTIRTLRGHTGGIYTMALARDGRLLASGGWDQTIRLWDLSPERRQRHVGSGHTGAVYGVTFSPDGSWLATGSLDKTVRIWDVHSGTQLRVLEGHENAVEGVTVSPDGRYLASGGSDRGIRIWELASGAQHRLLLGHTGEVTGLGFSPDGRLLASGSLDHTVRLWDWSAGSQLRVLRGHAGGVRDLDISPDGKQLVSCSNDQTARIWSLPGGRPGQVLTGHGDAVFGVAFSRDGRRVATGSVDRTVRLHDLARRTSREVIRQPSRVYMIDVHPDGRIGTSGSDGIGRIWDPRTGRHVALVGHRAEVNFLRFSPDGALAATTSDDGTVRLWRVDDGRPLWSAPLMLSAPPRLLTHQGWVSLDPRPGAEPPRPGAWQRSAEQGARLGAVTADGRSLCLVTFDGALEHWDLAGDWRLFSHRGLELQRVVAIRDGCLTLDAKGTARLHDQRAAEGQVLVREASAISVQPAAQPAEVLVAAGHRIHRFALDGARQGTMDGAVGASAILRTGRWLILGFSNGSVEPLASRPDPAPGFRFEQTPSSPVERMLEGPLSTLVVGFANGLWGIWSLQTGACLYHSRLHGAIRHLLLDGTRLYVASDLGQHATLDLAVLRMPYCDLLRAVWSEVPVIWEGGLPVRRAPPDDHRCRR